MTYKYCATQPSCWSPDKSIDLDDDHQKYFCRPDRAEKNLSPKQCLFSLVLYASALLSVCMDSTGSSIFAVWRCRVLYWIGRVCLHPQNVPVLGANSTPAVATAWAGWLRAVAACCWESGIIPGTQWRAHYWALCLVLSVFLTLRKQLFTPLWDEMFFKAIWVHKGILLFLLLCVPLETPGWQLPRKQVCSQ